MWRNVNLPKLILPRDTLYMWLRIQATKECLLLVLKKTNKQTKKQRKKERKKERNKQTSNKNSNKKVRSDYKQPRN